MTYEELEERYKKLKRGYSMRDNAHRLYKELTYELQNNKELMCELSELKSRNEL